MKVTEDVAFTGGGRGEGEGGGNRGTAVIGRSLVGGGEIWRVKYGGRNMEGEIWRVKYGG